MLSDLINGSAVIFLQQPRLYPKPSATNSLINFLSRIMYLLKSWILGNSVSNMNLIHTLKGRTGSTNKSPSLGILLLGGLLVLQCGIQRGFAEPVKPSDEKLLREGLMIRGISSSGRSAFRTNALESMIVLGTWTAPKEGDTVLAPDGTSHPWKVVIANEQGTFTNQPPDDSTNGMRGGYVYIPFNAASDEIKILEASGQDALYVNGEPHAGDPYGDGILQFPVQIHSGNNDFLFQFSRGQVRAKLVTPSAPILFNMRDSTLPDVIRGDVSEEWGAVVIVNCTKEYLTNLTLRSTCGTQKSVQNDLPSVPPMASRKVPFRIRPQDAPGTNVISLRLDLGSRGHRADSIASEITSLRVRHPDEHYRITFLSDIDGSVQYYGVAPARPLSKDQPAKALFLATHGASVQGMGMAGAYAPKTWGTVAAPTNRRPYGYDWEDWGRHDAMEVLALAQARFKTDPRQTYLTGHSMGGHGTWQIGVTYPDQFAAIAPSAGWISFWSYAGSEHAKATNAIQELLLRAATPGDTIALSSNYLHQAVYILHGDADDNVPVSEARTMRDLLAKFHHDFDYHEQPGAGHWWGNQCVDWPPIFDMFARHKIPDDENVADINFSTANPGISATSHWVSIQAQKHALAKSVVVMHFNADRREFSGTTENVARLSLKLKHVRPGGTVSVELDGQKFQDIPLPAPNQKGKVWFDRADTKWALTSEPSASQKGPHRYGPLKEAFGHHMMFVYATHGSSEENAWAYAKARFDAESWWYRGNGAVDVIPDAAFNATKEPDRGVVLYGNADNNSAWAPLLGDSPVQVRKGVVKIGSHEQTGADLACLFCRPRPGSDIASVAVISGSGLVGLKLTDRVPYLMPGIAYPDCTVFGSDTLLKGKEGVRVAGYFGNDWSVENGDFGWGQ